MTDRWSLRGGADWHLHVVLEALHEAGCELTLAVGRDTDATRPACRVLTLPGLDGVRDLDERRAALWRLCEEIRPDRIHLHNALAPELLADAARRGALLTVQDHRSFCPGQGKRTLAGPPCREPLGRRLCAGCFDDAEHADLRFERTQDRLRAVREMRAVVVLSEYMRDELCAAGVERSRTRVIPPFVHGLGGEPPSGDPCVLVAGRLVDTKGIDDAIEVWRRAEVDLPLVFAGTGSARARLERAGFQVLGWLPHSEMAGLYRRARALLMLPRWQEPFGIAGLEAASLGVPVVAWDSGGLSEWWPRARQIAWGDTHAAALELRRALRKPAPSPAVQVSRAEATQALWKLYVELGRGAPRAPHAMLGSG